MNDLDCSLFLSILIYKHGADMLLYAQIHPDLEPTAYQLAHTVFYEDDSVAYSTTFFNEVRCRASSIDYLTQLR
jgi:hypothetical protein